MIKTDHVILQHKSKVIKLVLSRTLCILLRTPFSRRSNGDQDDDPESLSSTDKCDYDSYDDRDDSAPSSCVNHDLDVDRPEQLVALLRREENSINAALREIESWLRETDQDYDASPFHNQNHNVVMMNNNKKVMKWLVSCMMCMILRTPCRRLKVSYALDFDDMDLDGYSSFDDSYFAMIDDDDEEEDNTTMTTATTFNSQRILRVLPSEVNSLNQQSVESVHHEVASDALTNNDNHPPRGPNEIVFDDTVLKMQNQVQRLDQDVCTVKKLLIFSFALQNIEFSNSFVYTKVDHHHNQQDDYYTLHLTGNMPREWKSADLVRKILMAFQRDCGYVIEGMWTMGFDPEQQNIHQARARFRQALQQQIAELTGWFPITKLENNESGRFTIYYQ